MSIRQIEAELKHLSAAELRRLALSSWRAYRQRERGASAVSECDETDPALIGALDEAVRRADGKGQPGATGAETRALLRRWITG